MKDNTNFFGLNKDIIKRINCVFADYPTIEKAIIFGSRAKGTYRNGSDIDLTLFGNINHDCLTRISTKLDDLVLQL